MGNAIQGVPSNYKFKNPLPCGQTCTKEAPERSEKCVKNIGVLPLLLGRKPKKGEN